MKILVTGSAGRLGTQLKRRLDSVDHLDVRYLRNPKGGSTAGPDDVDVTNEAALRSAVDSFAPESIIHLASIAGAACEDDIPRAEAVNVGAVRTIAAAARDSGVSRVLFASTSAVYGDQYDRPVREDDELHPASTYAQTKVEAESILREAADSSGNFHSIALRIFNVYGPGFDGSLIAKLEQSTASHPVELRDLDEFVRDYSHVDSVVDAIQSGLMAALDTRASTINIGSGVPTSNRDLVEQLGRKRDIHYQIVPAGYSFSCADIATARRVLGFHPVGRLSIAEH